MAIAAADPRPIPWHWSETACRRHRRYATRPLAEIEVAAHPAVAIFGCSKCDEGRPFVAFRCYSNPAHWHCGHDKTREEDTMAHGTQIDLSDVQGPPLMAGDEWRRVSKGSLGQPVRITRVTPTKVQFRAYGRLADSSQTYSLSIPVFRVQYAPLHLAAARQQELAKRPAPPAPAEKPEPVAEPSPVDAAIEEIKAEQAAPVPEGFTPRGSRIAPKLSAEQAREVYRLAQEPGANCAEIGRAYGVDGWTVAQIQRGITYRWATGASAAQKKPNARNAPKLTSEQAREMYALMRDGMTQAEAAKRFGVNHGTPSQIWNGRVYASATADLRAARLTTPDQPQQEEPAVQITTPPTTIETTEEAPAPTAPEPCDATMGVLPIWSNGRLVPSSFLTDLADALDVLVEYAGRPLPKYLRLDLDAIRALVARARSA